MSAIEATLLIKTETVFPMAKERAMLYHKLEMSLSVLLAVKCVMYLLRTKATALSTVEKQIWVTQS